MDLSKLPTDYFDKDADKCLYPATEADIAVCEDALGVKLENSLRGLMLQYGAGAIAWAVRVNTPRQIAAEQQKWRARIECYWFWDEGADVLSKEQALQSVCVADTFNGDEIVYWNGGYYVLPRDFETVFAVGSSFAEAVHWLITSGVIYEAVPENEWVFAPFPKNGEFTSSPG